MNNCVEAESWLGLWRLMWATTGFMIPLVVCMGLAWFGGYFAGIWRRPGSK